MTLSELCIRRPVFATVLVSTCVVMGMISFPKLGVDQYPDVDLPVVTVRTTLRGASPEEIETQVTKPIEDAVSTCEGIDELTSVSVEGQSSVTIRFVLERNGDQATQDVRDKIARVMNALPEDVDTPMVTRFDTTATPVATLIVESDRSLRELTELARELVQEPMQSVRGVGEVYVVGGRRRAFHVELNANSMTERGLSVAMVRNALRAENVEVPGGRVQGDGHEDILRTVARAKTAEELGRLSIANTQGAPVLLTDIARVSDGEEEPRSLSRLDGRNAVSLVVQKQSGQNTVKVVDALKARLDVVRSTLPEDVKVTVVRDQSTFILRSIEEVEGHLLLGGLLASLAVLLFMGSIRSTVIAALAIPSSIITTFAILRALDYTLNNFTLLALTLSVGIVIDDAIVVLENIYRHVEEGKSPMQAALDGTREITLAVFATTLSLIVVFLPTVFMEGTVGRFWQGFGVTTAFAIAVSLLVSLTLTPMLCARLLKATPVSDRGITFRLNAALDRGYGWLVGWSLRFRWLVVLIALGCVYATVPLVEQVGKDFVPQDDTGEFTVALTLPEGVDLASAARITETIEAKLRQVRGVESMLTRVGSGQGEDVSEVEIYVRLPDLETRNYSQDGVIAEVRKLLAPHADLRPAVSPVGRIGGGGRNSALQFNVRGPDLEQLGRITDEIMSGMRADGGFVDIDTASAVRKPELQVVVDRDRASDLGVRASEIAASLRTMVGGEPVSKIRVGDEQYDVWLRLRPEDRHNETTIAGLPIAAAGGLVRLDSVASLVRDRGPAQIERDSRIRKINVGANLNGIPLATAVERVQALAASIDMPPGYTVAFGGRARLLAETLSGFLGALGLSFIFMYLVLAAQFESFLHPITILMSLPLALPFALLSLILLGDTLNIYSAFGVFMLFGIVKKNGILQVDYTNTLRARGVERRTAIVEANITRLRPILMTTLTLVAGMIPLAMGTGAGAAARASMARVIIGGQALSLVITLLIVPVAYSLFDDAGLFLSRLGKRAPPVTPQPEAAEEE